MHFFNIRYPKQVLALTATLLFSVHPVHTEVVANIKGRDELLAALFFILSLHEYLRFIKSEKPIILISSVILLFLGLLSKEDAITLIPIALFFVLLRGKKYLLKGGVALAVLIIPVIIYMGLRAKFAGNFNLEESTELMNNPFLYAQANEKLPTILLILLWYLKLLILPHPLTFDYYPYHVSLVSWSHPLTWISLSVYSGIAIGIIYYFRRNSIISFFLAFFLFTLLPLSNLLLDVGTFMNERFLFLPSIAFCFILAYYIIVITEQKPENPVFKKIIRIVFVFALLSGSIKTIYRNRDWKNNFTLFLHDVKISSGSAKGNCMAGGILYEEALRTKSEAHKKTYLDQSINHLQKAIDIYPEYIDALLLLGNAYHVRDGNCKRSIVMYQRILSISPNYNLAFDNLEKILSLCNDPLIKIAGYKTILKYRPENYNANYETGITYGKVLHNLDSAVFFLQRAVEIKPESELAYRDLGVAYAMGGRHEASLPCFEKALELNPDDPGNYINLGITLQQLGQKKQSRKMFSKAEALKHLQAE